MVSFKYMYIRATLILPFTTLSVWMLYNLIIIEKEVILSNWKGMEVQDRNWNEQEELNDVEFSIILTESQLELTESL